MPPHVRCFPRTFCAWPCLLRQVGMALGSPCDCIVTGITYANPGSRQYVYNINAKRLKPNDLNTTYFWHSPLAHISEKRMKKLHDDGLLNSFDFESFETCESCLLDKMTKTPFAKSCERASDLLELIHTDVCGPMSTTARGGYQYFVTFTDNLSRYGYIYLMRHKSETFEKFKEFQNEVENQLGKTIKI